MSKKIKLEEIKEILDEMGISSRLTTFGASNADPRLDLESIEVVLNYTEGTGGYYFNLRKLRSDTTISSRDHIGKEVVVKSRYDLNKLLRGHLDCAQEIAAKRILEMEASMAKFKAIRERL